MGVVVPNFFFLPGFEQFYNQGTSGYMWNKVDWLRISCPIDLKTMRGELELSGSTKNSHTNTSNLSPLPSFGSRRCIIPTMNLPVQRKTVHNPAKLYNKVGTVTSAFIL